MERLKSEDITSEEIHDIYMNNPGLMEVNVLSFLTKPATSDETVIQILNDYPQSWLVIGVLLNHRKSISFRLAKEIVNREHKTNTLTELVKQDWLTLELLIELTSAQDSVSQFCIYQDVFKMDTETLKKRGFVDYFIRLAPKDPIIQEGYLKNHPDWESLLVEVVSRYYPNLDVMSVPTEVLIGCVGQIKREEILEYSRK